MSITSFYNKTVSTERLAQIADSYKQEWSENISSLECAIHQTSGEQSNLGGSAFFQSFKMWCAIDTDIQIGDKVIDGSNTYIVKGVSNYNYGSEASQHLLVILELGD